MSYAPLISKILLSFILTSTVLYRYGNWFRHRIFVTIIVLLAWYCSFLIIFALPLDVISTVYRQCLKNHGNVTYNLSAISNSSTVCEEPWSNVPVKVFPNLWRTVYWSTQCLTWLIMPFMQSYIKAGDFTVKGKLKSALIDNIIYYGSYLLICGILLIYLALKPGIDLDWSKLKAIASSASNTWGLFLLVLLLGYALVNVPRQLWNKSNRNYMLSQSYFKAARMNLDRSDAEDAVLNCVYSLNSLCETVPPGQLLQYVETILQKVPTELRATMPVIPTPAGTTDIPTEKSLARLHKKTIKAFQVFQRTETQWHRLVENIFDLEDIVKNQISRDRRFKKTFQKERTWYSRFNSASIEWYWKCILYCYVQKGLGIIAAIFSISVVWSEVTFFNIDPPISIFAIIVNTAKEHYDYFTIEILSTAVILYLCYCAYSTVLKIRFFDLYYLAPHHQTDEYSLIFSGMMLCRLTPPLCLNFLGLIHMDSHVIKSQVMETFYTQVMGHMDVIDIISHGFNIYFPMAILLLCLATIYSIGSRVLSALGYQQFIDNDDEMTAELVDEGRELIKREKRKRMRHEEHSMRRREYLDRFSAPDRFRHRHTDPVRQMTQLDNLDGTRSNLLRDGRAVESYDGTRFGADDDARFASDTNDDIDARFGASTRVNERYDSSPLEPRFSDTYQLDGSYRSNRVGIPPRGIFDDV